MLRYIEARFMAPPCACDRKLVGGDAALKLRIIPQDTTRGERRGGWWAELRCHKCNAALSMTFESVVVSFERDVGATREELKREQAELKERIDRDSARAVEIDHALARLVTPGE